MDITIDTIIKYLTETPKNTFSNKLNIMQNQKDFTFFQDYFDDSFYRYGIYLYDDDENNISLYTSILFCIDPNYIYKDKDVIIDLINELKNNINTEHDILQEIVNYLKINILIFDFKNEMVKSCYYSEFLNPWRPIIFLANYDNFWEPICTQETKIFGYISNKVNVLKNKILVNNITYVNDSKYFQLNDNFLEILDNEKLLNSDTNSENDELFINNIILCKNITKNKLKKMKKIEIIDLMNELNIESNDKKMIKNSLIDIICNKFNL